MGTKGPSRVRRVRNAIDRRRMRYHGRKAYKAFQRGKTTKARKHLRKHDTIHLGYLTRVIGKR